MPLPSGPFNLFNFRTTIGDPARPFLFLVHIPEIGSDQVVTSLARNTSLPGYTLDSVPIDFQGTKIKIGTTPQFSAWEVEFLCDEAHELRRLLLKWQSLVYDIGTGSVGHSNTYKSDSMSVAQLARNGQIVANYGFVGAWPKEVAPIQVSHENSQAVETFKVTFEYDYHILIDQGGTQTTVGSFVRSNKSVKIERGNAPPAGNWKTPFKPQ